MPAKTKTKSRFSKINVFANSPRVVKLFGPLLILLMIAAAGYGGYTLFKNQLSGAISPGTYFYDSKGIGHKTGSVGNDKNIGINSGRSWYAQASLLNLNANNQYVWYGPFANLRPGQYLGCFYYTFDVPMNVSLFSQGSAVIDVYDHGKTYNNTTVAYNNTFGTKSHSKYNRTCLAFYIPKGTKSTEIELRVKLTNGYIVIKKTSITGVSGKNNGLSNTSWLNGGDNKSIIQGYDYR